MMIFPAISCTGRINQSDRIHFMKINIDGDKLTLDYYDRGRLGNDPQPPATHYTIQKDAGYECNVIPEDGDEPVEDGDEPVEDGDEPVEDGDEPVEDGDVPVPDGDEPVEDGDEPPKECTPGTLSCEKGTVIECDPTGQGWRIVEECSPDLCVDGECVAAPPVEDGDDTTKPPTEPEPNAASGGGSGCHHNGSSNASVLFGLLMLSFWLVSRRRKEF